MTFHVLDEAKTQQENQSSVAKTGDGEVPADNKQNDVVLIDPIEPENIEKHIEVPAEEVGGVKGEATEAEKNISVTAAAENP